MNCMSMLRAPGILPLAACESGERTSRIVLTLPCFHHVLQFVDGYPVHPQLQNELTSTPPFRCDVRRKRDQHQDQSILAERLQRLQNLEDCIAKDPTEHNGHADPEQRTDCIEQNEFPIAQADCTRPSPSRRMQNRARTWRTTWTMGRSA
jgi:hypothetical protein